MPVETVSPRRLLIITEHQGWPSNGPTVVGWDELAAITNVRDFDDLVIDVSEAPLGTVEVHGRLRSKGFEWPDERSQDIWTVFDRLFDSNAIGEFLASGGRIVVLGDASFMRPTKLHGSWGPRREFNSFLKLGMKWEVAAGTRFEITEAGRERGVEDYLTNLGRYDRSLTDLELYVRRDGMGRPLEPVPRVRITPYATTRAGKPIAFQLLWEETGAEASLLPLPTHGHREAIRSAIRSLLGVDFVDDAPAWATQIRVPEEDAIDAKQAGLLRQIGGLQEEYQAADVERGSARTAIELLYAMDDVLERAVRAAFAELGAAVEEPTDPSKEDGWITVTVSSEQLRAVLEIKSTVNPQFKVAGIRQLGEWVQRGINQRGVQYKPIFVGSSSVREPVADRPNPFVHDFARTAVQFDAALLRADVLFEALMTHRRGLLDNEAFWRHLFGSVGPVSADSVRATPTV